MTYLVNDFPIFHRYLASILLEVELAKGDFSDILDKVGEFTVHKRCECGDELCSTLEMESETLVGTDFTLCCAFNIGFIIFSFYEDGFFKLESLSGTPEKSYPFKQEVIDVLGGKKVEYEDGYAERLVRDFMDELEQEEIRAIEV